jgi:hypothetical protein
MAGRVLDKLVDSDEEMTEFSYSIRLGIVDVFLRVYARECVEDKNQLTHIPPGIASGSIFIDSKRRNVAFFAEIICLRRLEALERGNPQGDWFHAWIVKKEVEGNR